MHSALCDYLTVVKGFRYPSWGYFLRAKSFYNTTSYIDYLDIEGMSDNDYIDYMRKQEVADNSCSRHNMSHGEKRRTSNGWRIRTRRQKQLGRNASRRR